MPKDIKIKKKDSHSIRKLDRSVVFTSRIKRSMQNQYEKTKKEKYDNEEKSNTTNYAINATMHTGNSCARESTYFIVGTSKTSYKKAKTKLTDSKLNKKENEENNILEESKKEIKPMKFPNINKNENSNNEFNKNQSIKELQKKKLVKEKPQNAELENDKNNFDVLNIKQKNNKIQIVEMKKSFNVNEVTNSTNNIENIQILKKAKHIQKNVQKIKETSKKVGKAVANSAKAIIESSKSIIVLISLGGAFFVMIAIVMVLIAGVIGSAFGMFFSNETKQTVESMTINSAINLLKDEVDREIENTKNKVNYDTIEYSNKDISWKNVLSIYSVITTNREKNYDITQMNDGNYEKLKGIFWDTVNIEYDTEKYTVTVTSTDSEGNKTTRTETRTRLRINVKCMSLEEMIEYYNLSEGEKNQLYELNKAEYNEMWDLIL